MGHRSTVGDDGQRARLWRRLRVEAYCLGLVFWFHDENNHLQKFVTIALTVIVVPVVIGAAFGVANPPDVFLPLAALWGIIIAKAHDLEINNFAGVELEYIRDEEEGDDGD